MEVDVTELLHLYISQDVETTVQRVTFRKTESQAVVWRAVALWPTGEVTTAVEEGDYAVPLRMIASYLDEEWEVLSMTSSPAPLPEWHPCTLRRYTV